ncbi:MAG: DNA polymerase III subunit delta' [Candidatus Peregrinibacteria bacterium Gr01-1014_25]|nr:MAG: DNA polymerase III subunit delta' [Candidatus Peregrinibacteria bacterium Gr01-1014_25]
MPDTVILGHERQREALLDDLAQDNVSHAYLFEGPPHIGKFTVARWFARMLLLHGLGDAARADAESRIDRLLHPDLLMLDQLWIEERCEDWAVIGRTSNVPQEHRMKAKAKTDAISIDDVRVIQDRLYETGMGAYRCCCLRSAERMQPPAANALLKILEEPPPGRVFFLTTQHRALLPPTVVSRTRVIPFYRLPDTALQPLLEEQDPDAVRFLLHLAQGAPGLLLRLRADSDLLLREKQLHASAARVWQGTLFERLRLLQPLAERGEEADRFLLHLALTARELTQPPAEAIAAFHRLSGGLETNAHRGLLIQQFAMALGE